MAKTLFTKRQSFRVLAEILSEHKEFTNNGGSFYGRPIAGAPRSSVGRMDEADRQIMLADEENHGIEYMIWSYYTPVAWLRRDGFWRVSTRNYSRTTAAHLGKLRPAIAEISN